MKSKFMFYFAGIAAIVCWILSANNVSQAFEGVTFFSALMVASLLDK